MNRGKILLAILFIALSLIPLSQGQTVQTFNGGSVDINATYKRLLFLNTTIFFSQGDFTHYPWEADNLNELADAGILINFRIDWWAGFANGEIAWNTSVVDFYYNSSRRDLLEDELNNAFVRLDINKLWAITLSEEGPGASYWHFKTPAQLRKYNSTYHNETGFWLKYPLYQMNKTENLVLDNWLNEKNNWFFNYLYDFFKQKRSDLPVFQFIFLYPGAIPVWGGGGDLSGLKADGHFGDLYYYDVYQNPFWMYEYVRQYKTTYPDVPYYIFLWGEEPWLEEGGLAGGFEHARRNAWIAYLGGADGIAWFDWHYKYGWVWDREDSYGKRFAGFLSNINEELEKLPVFKPRPEVLVIRDNPNSFQLGLSCDLGVFNEWDLISQKALIYEKPDLSQYKLIVVSEDSYFSETVEMLNQYVRDGGNLIQLGGFGWEQTNYYYNGSRTEFLNEVGIRQEHLWGDVLIEIDEPNPLGVSLSYEQLSSSLLGLPTNQLTINHQAIGEFSHMDSGVLIEDINPLVLYHNKANPDEGSILYWGVPNSRSQPLPEYRDVVESFIDEMNYTRYLYRLTTRAYALNYLGMTGSIAKVGEENLIISQAEVEDGVILAGLSNFNDHQIITQYSLDLDRFEYQQGNYLVYSLDNNTLLGEYESDENMLYIPLSIEAQGTRLLWISMNQSPTYHIDIFPKIPTEEEVEDFWPVVEQEPPQPEPEPEPEPEPSPEPEPEPEPEPPVQEEESQGIPGFQIISIILAISLLVYVKKQ